MKTILISILTFSTFLTVHLTSQDPLEVSIQRGEVIYEDFCVTCHLPHGQGIQNTYPPLAKSDFLMENRKASIHLLKYGINKEIIVNGVTYNGNMPAMELDDDEIADVMNYITNTWSNTNSKMITETEVESIKK
ncbi:c-type cytochrome [Pseudotamlana carrageenivorans]|uniref:Cytochrome C n=1 Tax=Pseudotamlana carrageenivorans TaxID=2069432 RepID=A0A2I7SF60_9FLAO|nr:cytochrome c [Tamlana carrageenivorans]AUS04553.1 cytochrome C [Tamlana carrageenivorans]